MVHDAIKVKILSLTVNKKKNYIFITLKAKIILVEQ